MGKGKGIILVLAAALLAVSCMKDDFAPLSGYEGPVVSPGRAGVMKDLVFRFVADVPTKGVDAISVPTSLYWGGVHHKADNSMEIAWSCTLSSVETDPDDPSGRVIFTGQQKDDTDYTVYDFYVSNFPFDLSPASSNILNVTQNNYDVLVGYRSASGNDFENGVNMQLEHIFAKTGTLSFPDTDVYEFTNLTWRIIGKGALTGTRGSYNMATGEWISATTPLSSYYTITSSSNYYVIPGVYTIKVNGRIRSKVSGKTEDFEVVSDVNLLKGKRNNITGQLSGNFINDWENKGDIILD